MPAVREAVVDGLFYPAAPAALRAQVAGLSRRRRRRRRRRTHAEAADRPARRLRVLRRGGGARLCPARTAARADGPPRRAARPRASRRAARSGGTERRGFRDAAGRGRRSTSPRWPAWTTCRRWFATTGRTSASTRSRSSCRSCRRCSAASPSCRWSSATPAPRRWRRCSSALWGGDETLIVISSDLSHYLRYEQAQAADRATIQRILALDAGLAPHEACGAAAINGALLAARRHGLAPRLLDLCNSGDTAGDRDRVVGYGAIAFEERQRMSPHPGALVAPARRRSHPVRPVPARLPAARRPARHVLRAPARRRRDGAHHLRAQLGLLHRPDREEAAQPLLSRHRACCRFGTAGCNLACKFCQNWDISKSREMDRLMDAASPEQIAAGGREPAVPRAWPSPTTTR